jgi:hypothetical protein
MHRVRSSFPRIFLSQKTGVCHVLNIGIVVERSLIVVERSLNSSAQFRNGTDRMFSFLCTNAVASLDLFHVSQERLVCDCLFRDLIHPEQTAPQAVYSFDCKNLITRHVSFKFKLKDGDSVFNEFNAHARGDSVLVVSDIGHCCNS